MKHISILGSTGSIGKSALEIVRAHSKYFKVAALAMKKNSAELAAQALEFKPSVVCLYDEAHVPELRSRLSGKRIRIVSGAEGLEETAVLPSADISLFAIVGAIGLQPIFAAVKKGKTVAIANKEPLVMAGRQLMAEALKCRSTVIPVDSEHSGMWQCLEGKKPDSIRKLILTSSGGPFRAHKGSLAHVKPKQALKHPRWKMGPKITIDSSTLMNKGLEVIEAVNLFGMPPEKVDVLVHPESVIHALVEFVDGSQLAHLGITDMRLPIQYAFTYPERLDSLPSLNLAELKSFNFEKPDLKRFPCLELGYEAAYAGGSMPAVLNAANEIAVENFLSEKISFSQIPKIIETSMRKHRVLKNPSVESLIEADLWARNYAKELL